ncbi:DUF4435 domain-containing protein [Klebsiella michiganensis]|uniref:DUF4435 domain-containing protein n=1 Tax=Klebsiella michiganensis TaxID=1134687 RepID=UPI0032DA0666
MNSMRNLVSPSDRVSGMLLLFRTPQYNKKIFFTLEGESDIRFLNTHFSHERIHYDSPCSGKPEVIDAVSKLRLHGRTTAYGLCDADFDILEGKNYENIHFTDCHDLEMMLIEGGSFDKFIAEFINVDILRQHSLEDIKNDLKNNLKNICYKIGLIKWMNYKQNLLLMFKGMNYNHFISVDGLNITIDMEKYITHILQRSHRKPECCNYEYINSQLPILESLNADYKHVCNGHDFTYLLMMVFRGSISRDRNITQERVESHLRMGYPKESFEQTGIFSHISQVLLKHLEN